VTRLYLQIYATVLASLLAFALISGATWRLLRDAPEMEDRFGAILQFADLALPPPDSPPAEVMAALQRMHLRFDADLALFSPDRRLLGSVGPPPPPPPPGRPPRLREGRGHMPHEHARPQFERGRVQASVALADGRILVIQRSFGVLDMVPRIFIVLTASALAVAVAAYPLARRLARRLEALKAAVDAFGAGRLDSRAKLSGRDEVATLAASFNQAADRIEALLAARKTLLANASHELRSPLARLTMATEMLPEGVDPKRRAEIARNIAELDQLVGEILLASRLDADDTSRADVDVDLLGLLAEEAAIVGASVSGVPATIRGDPRLLARMARNLLENARRYGGGTPIEASLGMGGDGLEMTIADRGPGGPDAERDRIFEPFYRVPGSMERDGGVGLGLSLVRQIADRHGAKVRCLARDGGGLKFVVTFPYRPIQS
jgi:signal transduction histidine kinase